MRNNLFTLTKIYKNNKEIGIKLQNYGFFMVQQHDVVDLSDRRLIVAQNSILIIGIKIGS